MNKMTHTNNLKLLMVITSIMHPETRLIWKSLRVKGPEITHRRDFIKRAVVKRVILMGLVSEKKRRYFLVKEIRAQDRNLSKVCQDLIDMANAKIVKKNLFTKSPNNYQIYLKIFQNIFQSKALDN